MILRDERSVIPIGSYQPEYKVTLSLPTVIGKAGAIKTYKPKLTAHEGEALAKSAEALRKARKRQQADSCEDCRR
jgi:L-lactate dehydrogenase